MTEIFPKIKSIEIKKLFGEKDLKWDLEDSVNVLVGNNGAGKSTLLKIIREVLANKDPKFLEKTDNVKIEFTDGSEIFRANDKFSYEKFINSINLFKSINPIESLPKSKKQADIFFKSINNHLKDYIEQYFENIGKNLEIKNYQLENKDNAYYKFIKNFTDSKADNNKSKKDVAVEYVSTVDMSANSTREFTKSDGEMAIILEWEISQQLSRIQSQQITDEKTYLKIKKRINDSLNLFLGDSGKSVSFDKDIVITYKENTIDITSLSSGEKQVIYIFLSVANAYFNRAIILMDEPEISLHLNWQEKLISTIRKINPDSQLIIVTHSPAIVMKGWLSYFKDIADITVGSKS
ncbi:MAG: AAA family ATPase [Zymomonas mobilis]|uniref:AAA family ATPase n=1 Tax=Zymomonas mobilis TaxID=542 RepID=UPI0039E9192C